MSDTIRAICRKLGCSESTFYKAKAAGLIKPEKNGLWDLRKVTEGILLQGMKRGGRHVGGDGGVPLTAAMAAIKQEQAQEELALTRAKRMKAQQELAKASGELVLMSDVKRAIAELTVSFRDAIYAVPDQIALRCDLKPARQVAGIVRTALHAVIQKLSNDGWRTIEKVTP